MYDRRIDPASDAGPARAGRRWNPGLGLVGLAIAGLAAGCGPQVRVRTSAEPDADFGRLRTFSIMETPRRKDGRRSRDDDPMLVNSRSYRTIRAAIRDEFEQLGYREVDHDADFTIAYYATTREKLDVTLWDYGYAWRPRRWRFGPPYTTATQYTQGTVIIDVVDPATREPIWRGSGVARTSDDPGQYREDLRKVVAKIAEKFPPAGRHVNAER